MAEGRGKKREKETVGRSLAYGGRRKKKKRETRKKEEEGRDWMARWFSNPHHELEDDVRVKRLNFTFG